MNYRFQIERRAFLKSAMAALAAGGFGRQAMAMQADSRFGHSHSPRTP